MTELRELFDALAREDEERGADAVWNSVSRRRSRAPVVAAAVVVAVAAVVVALVATGGGEDDSHVEVVQPPPSNGGLLVWEVLSNDGMDAGVGGEVLIDDATGCVLLSGRPVVWPYGTTWSIEGEEIRLPSGVLLNEGDVVRGGGGFLKPDALPQIGGPVIPPACRADDEVAVFNRSEPVGVLRPGAPATFSYAYGMARSADGELAVSDTQSDRVYIRLKSGDWFWIDGSFDDPKGLTYGGSDLYVADEGNNRIQVIEPFGPPRTWDAQEPLNSPVAVAIDPRGQDALLVAEGNGNRIRRLYPSGRSETVGVGCSPWSVAALADFSVYFGSLCDKLVRRIGPEGDITTVEGMEFGSAIAAAPDGGLYIANGRSSEIWHLAADGTATKVLTFDRSNASHNDCAARGYSGGSEAIAMVATEDDLLFVDSGSGNICRLAGDRITKL